MEQLRQPIPIYHMSFSVIVFETESLISGAMTTEMDKSRIILKQISA